MASRSSLYSIDAMMLAWSQGNWESHLALRFSKFSDRAVRSQTRGLSKKLDILIEVNIVSLIKPFKPGWCLTFETRSRLDERSGSKAGWRR